MIPGRPRLLHLRFAIGHQSGQQDARLHLSAGDGQPVPDPGQPAALDQERRKAPVPGLDPGAHSDQRFHDALHGALIEGRVPLDPGGEPARRQQGREQPDGGPAVLNVQRPARRSETPPSRAVDLDAGGVSNHSGAERLDTGESGPAVFAGGEIADPGGAIGHAPQKGVTMGNALVSRHPDLALEGSPDRIDSSRRHPAPCPWAMVSGPPAIWR